ncbi:MAG: hypothetical protein ABI874_09345, partial [Chloroflexota bacterium]
GENGNGIFDGNDLILFSLARGSPTLTRLTANAADLLQPGPWVAFYASTLGLQANDNVTAMKCGAFAIPPVNHLYLPIIRR